MLGYESLKEALDRQPQEMINVDERAWRRLRAAYQTDAHPTEFRVAWSNGVAFFRARSGLRNRRPLRVEWRGGHKNPGYDFIPADLRVDHVYLVSCKYGSRLLLNASPSFLFERLLADREGRRGDWYLDVAPSEYRELYRKAREHVPFGPDLPSDITRLSREDRDLLKRTLRGRWPSALLPEYASFSHAVAITSAKMWAANLTSLSKREEMLWRLLRLAPAPYFILGVSSTAPIRLRVHTPWDWRREFRLRSFDVAADLRAEQPKVRWDANVLNQRTGERSVVEGHIEVRWAHGKFGASPEAKVYLDTPHIHVPGYAQLG